MKLCKDCIHVYPASWICDCPKNIVESDVNGKTAHRLTYCESQRKHGFMLCRLLNTCGKEGRWWEPKEANRCQV